ncbi:phage tail sheath family protein [Jeotgalibacillus malaysiensis]|uniref:phage tail sheath family protein n=1 Tax=Jeotgalibacillus malaysiensis TaxID=1508404 RepID=UPI00384CD713
MNGGTFTPGVEKERAGIYFRFTSAAQQRLSVGVRGTVALPAVLGWGPSKQFISIRDTEDIEKKIGLSLSDPSMLLLKEAKKKAQTVLLYRVNEGSKASADLTATATATAKYGGSKGNEIVIKVAENVVDSLKKDVTTFVNEKAFNRQTVTDATELVSNDWVDFSGAGALEDSAGLSLTGGENGEPVVLDYTDFLEAAETEYFDVIALPVDDEEELKTTFVSFVKRVRDQQGQKITGVLPNFAGDYEGIINVTTEKVVLEDGTELSAAEQVAWVAGASAGASITQSLTFMEYEGAVDISPRLGNDDIIDKLKNGEFLFTHDPRERSVSVEKDINSFTSFTNDKNERFSKNRIIRVLDAINNDIRRELRSLIQNRKNNGLDIPANNDGVQIVTTLATVYMNALQDGSAIQNFNSQNDIQISINEAGDGFYINMGAQPVDSAEKFYFGVEVR